MSRAHRPAFTLLELVVVLALVSIAMAVVAPAILPARQNAAALAAQLIQDSRRAATHRGEALQLDVDTQGRWSLTRNLSGDPSILREGALPQSREPFRIVFSPVGICRLTRPATFKLDALSCVVLTRSKQ